ncbi:MAG: hypothetical protein IT508_12150 [Burkholderiaceae bacterium]|nr:hypothetical protein [Burkholderiaceae bacterium]
MLDTNVRLDWLVFTDASVTTIARGVQAAALQVLGSDARRAEWLEVTARPDAPALHAALSGCIARL